MFSLISINRSSQSQISDDEGNILCNSFKYLGNNMNSYYFYQIVKRNLECIILFIERQQNKMDKPDMIECNRLLYNFVDTLYAFVNYFEKNYNSEFKNIKSEIYNTFFEYRLIYNLRNYMIHDNLAILKVTNEIDKSFINVKFIIQKNKILSSTTANNKLKTVLNEATTDDIDIYPILKQQFHIIKTLQEKMLFALSNELLRNFKLITDRIINKEDTFLFNNEKLVNSLLNVTTKYYKCLAENFVYEEKYSKDTNVMKLFLKFSFIYYGEENVICKSNKISESK